MITIDRLGDDKMFIKTDHDLRDRELIKSLPGSRYDMRQYHWVAPLTWATCRALRGIFGQQITIGESLVAWATEHRRAVIDPALKLRTIMDTDGDKDLYPFQRAGVQFLATIKRGLLLDEMGTGKTVQTIRTLMELTRRGESVFPAIVVGPNNMCLTWKKECEKWWPGLTVAVVKGSLKQRREILAREDVHVFIINFEGVRGHSRLAAYGGAPRLKKCVVCDPTLADIPANNFSRCENCKKELNKIHFRTVIVDEVHRLKDPKAKQTRACWALKSPATEFVYGLSGTAIAKAPDDMWPALFLISSDEWPNRGKYIDRYCSTSFNFFGGMTVVGLKEDTKAEFFDIVDPHMRRMPKEAVLPFLPKKTYSERYLEMTPKQKSSYKQMEAGLVAMVSDGAVAVASNPLVQLTRLSQFASAYAEINDEGSVVMTAPSNKVNGLLELLDEMGQEPLVVFAQSRQLIELAAAALTTAKISHGLIVGGQTQEEREEAKEDFQAGRVRVILCTIAAGGVGITLTRASTACFMQRSWSMIDNKQAEDRVHRIGSEIHDKILIVDLISLDTFESRQRVALGVKEDRLEEVMRDKQTIAMVLGLKKEETK